MNTLGVEQPGFGWWDSGYSAVVKMEEGSRLKSTKEPKEGKKSSAKPRKTSAKSKQQGALEPAPEMVAASVEEPQALASAHAVNGSSNGSTAAAGAGWGCCVPTGR